jgi:hypothetical protein
MKLTSARTVQDVNHKALENANVFKYNQSRVKVIFSVPLTEPFQLCVTHFVQTYIISDEMRWHVAMRARDVVCLQNVG